MTEEELIETLAQNVAAKMAERGLTQEDLERAGGLGQATVSAVLNRKGAATMRTLCRLAAAIGCMPWELLVNDRASRDFYLRRLLGGG